MNATWKSNQVRTGMDKRQKLQNTHNVAMVTIMRCYTSVDWEFSTRRAMTSLTNEPKIFRLQLRCGERMVDSGFKFCTEEESRIQQEAAIRNASVDATCNIRLQEYWGSTKKGSMSTFEAGHLRTMSQKDIKYVYVSVRGSSRVQYGVYLLSSWFNHDVQETKSPDLDWTH